jgi:hypothetical protein
MYFGHLSDDLCERYLASAIVAEGTNRGAIDLLQLLLLELIYNHISTFFCTSQYFV